jgi:hypothetical protein
MAEEHDRCAADTPKGEHHREVSVRGDHDVTVVGSKLENVVVAGTQQAHIGHVRRLVPASVSAAATAGDRLASSRNFMPAG